MNGSRQQRSRAAVALGALACALAIVGPAALSRSQDRGPSRSEFMRQKLDFTKGLVEGLALEDYDRIADNARKLKVLSQAAEWEVPYIPDVEAYLPYTTEFQRLCDDLTKQARARNIEGATLAYMGMTMNCVNCHKYVRRVKH